MRAWLLETSVAWLYEVVDAVRIPQTTYTCHVYNMRPLTAHWWNV